LQGLWCDSHGTKQILDNASTQASPTAVGSADDCAFAISKDNGQAVSGEDGAGDARMAGKAGVSFDGLSDVIRG
jgi:hypothetical protein